MSCPEINPLVPRFFDGELSGRQMRSVALHITRCEGCEGDLRMLERVQDLVAEQVNTEVEDLDLSPVWGAVSAQIEESPMPWFQGLRAWWEDAEIVSPMTGWSAVAAAAAVLLAFAYYPSADKPTPEVAQRVAGVASAEVLIRDALAEAMNNNSSAVFESIVGSVDRLMVEPETQTAVLWVNDPGDLQ